HITKKQNNYKFKTLNIRLIFEKEGVYLHTNAKRSNQDTTIPGFIRIVERAGVPALEWSPLEDEGRTAPAVLYTKKDGEGGEEDTNFDPGYEPDWAVISTVKKDREHVPVRDSGQWSFSLPLSELYSLRRARFSLGRNFLVFTSRGGHPLPPLHFHRGGTRELLRAMHRYIILDQSPVDGRLFLAYPHDSGALSQSFDKLQLLDDGGSDLVSRFIQDPYATTFGGFSKVTNFFKAALRPPDSSVYSRTAQDPSFPLQPDEEPGFELITCGVELGPRPDVTRGQPMDKWEEFLDPQGRVKNPERIKELVFRGGITPNLRKEVWKFLLGFYPWNSTTKEREDILRVKTLVDEYFRMKVQWKSVSEEQEMRNSLLRGYRSLIERDVSRTDRHNTFFSGNDNPGLTLLHDVLMTYCMYNFDLGYVQGMSDLLSPLLFVTQNEVESFWCLTGFMELVHQNFEESQEAMKQQLLQLSVLLKALDPELCDFLDSQDSGSLCFCFRWLLIWFKREFSFEDILILWEVLWTRLPCDNFHLLIACSILQSQRGELIGSDHDFNTILKHINELTMKLDLQSVLRGAEAIYLQLIQCKELPLKVQQVLGLYIPSSSEEDSPDSQASETQRLLSESQAGAASSNSASDGLTVIEKCMENVYI
uniref:TBC1 domain family member 15 n=1 Tax=Dicentrarchus labrax TaxID=13489 RepID=A0A8C4IBU0_DICLA